MFSLYTNHLSDHTLTMERNTKLVAELRGLSCERRL